jgi:hypothetical protein
MTMLGFGPNVLPRTWDLFNSFSPTEMGYFAVFLLPTGKQEQPVLPTVAMPAMSQGSLSGLA